MKNKMFGFPSQLIVEIYFLNNVKKLNYRFLKKTTFKTGSTAPSRKECYTSFGHSVRLDGIKCNNSEVPTLLDTKDPLHQKKNACWSAHIFFTLIL